MGILKVLLNQLAEVGRAELRSQSDDSVSGAYHTVTFWETKDLAATKLAVSHRQVEDNEEKSREENEILTANRVQKLLIDQGVDTRFLQTFLAFDKTGSRYSVQATEGSLKQYMEQHSKHISREQIKDIFVQMLLGIKALHEKNLVHRDVNLGNALVFINAQNRLTVMISDFDTVIGASNLTPENQQYIDELNKNRPEGFAWRLLKADDCNNLSEIFKELIADSEPDSISLEEPSVKALLDLLSQPPLRNNFNSTSTVEIALESDFFGPSKASRASYFQELRDRAQPYEFIGEYRARAFESDNPFLLVKDNLKFVYSLARKLDSQFDFFDVVDREFDEAKVSSDILSFSLKSLIDNFKKCDSEITACIKNSTFTKEREVLLQLKNQAVLKMATICLKYRAPTNIFIELARAAFTETNTID